MDKNPLVSVIMALYNGEEFLAEAIESILSQTYNKIELIIIDDCSKDKSLEIAKSFESKDSRVTVISNDKNLGLALSLDKGISISKGEFLARMDQDDISLPNRIKKQLNYLEKNPNVDISGTWVKTIGAKAGLITKHPTNPEEVKVNLLFHTSLVHPTIMIRREFLVKTNLHYKNIDDQDGNIEDFDFYTRAILAGGRLSNQPEVLLLYRRHDKQTTVEKIKTQVEFSKKIFRRELENLNIIPEESDLEILASVKRYLFLDDREFPKKLEKLLIKIEEANNKTKFYKDSALKKVFGRVWMEVCMALSMTPGNNKNLEFKTFYNSRFRKYIELNPKNIFRIAKIKFQSR